MLLAEQIEYNNRNDAEQNQRHRCAEVNRTIASLEELDVDRNRHILCTVKYKIRQEIVVPYPHDFKNTDRNQRRLHHRKNNLEIGLYRTGTVNCGSLFNLKRN